MAKKQNVPSNSLNSERAKLKEAQDDHGAGRYQVAEKKFRSILMRHPRLIQAQIGLSVNLCAQGKNHEAWAIAEPLLNFDHYKAQPIDLGNLSWVARQSAKFVEAATFGEAAVALKPDYALGWLNLSATYRDLRRLSESEEAARKAIKLLPDFHGGYLNLGSVFLDRGLHNLAEESMRKARDCKIDDAHNWNNLLFCMVNNVSQSAEDIYIEAVKFGEQFTSPNIHEKRFPLPEVVKRLNIGFVSGDFRNHVICYFLDPLLARLNREAFKIFLYSNTASPDHVTTQMKRYADEWIDVFSFSNADLKSKIENDKIDILIDLSGHTSFTRLMVFAEKPAPIQVSWLGFSCTTGLKTIDWRITDGIADGNNTDGHYTESLWRLPSILCCYRPCIKVPSRRYHLAYETILTPAINNGYIVFGSCNSPAKITDEVLETWGKILFRTPNSKLLIEGRIFNDDIAKETFIQRCDLAGVDVSRLILIPTDNSQQYLTYHKIDIALDTFPMTGWTTTFDALWMGVPVITLTGNEFRNRVSTSILNALKHNEWTNCDLSSYIDCAVNLALDVQELNRIRLGLRREFEKSPAMDATLFAEEFGSALQGMWRKYCESRNVVVHEMLDFSAPAVTKPLIFLGSGKTLTLPEGIQRANSALIEGDLSESKQWCGYVLWEEPHHPEALAIVARIARIQGIWNEFYGFMSHAADADPKNEGLYREMIEIACEHNERETVLGTVMIMLKRIPERSTAWQDFLNTVSDQLNPASSWTQALNQIVQPIEAISTVSATPQQQAHALTQRGNALILANRSGEAIPLIQHVLTIHPTHAPAWVAMAAIFAQLECYVAAIDAARNALKFDPNDGSAHNNLALALKGIGDLPATIELLQKALVINPDNKNFVANLLLNMSYSDDFSPQDIKNKAEKVVAHWHSGGKSKHSRKETEQSPYFKIRIGFVTPDVNSHPVMYCLAPLLTHYDRNYFELYLYHTRAFSDGVTNWAKVHTAYCNVAALSSEDLATKIQSDGIDVLFDLAGFTAGHALDVFAFRSAPVQVSWLGYPGTTGMTAIDWRLTDSIVDPQGSEVNYVEKLWRLPTVHCPYRPLISAHHKRWLSEYQVLPTPAIDKGYITFGCCNNLVKASPRVLRLWKRVLDAVPNSRLLVEARGVDDALTLEKLQQQFESHGFTSSQLIWVSRRSAPQYSTYHKIDIALDTSPYTGWLTTFDTLWMGVPLVTLMGQDARSRVSASALHAADLKEWIATTEGEYIQIATQLAENIPMLNRVRLGLRRRIESSVFMNESMFTRDFENTVIAMLEQKNVPIPVVTRNSVELCVIMPDEKSYSLVQARENARNNLAQKDYDALIVWARSILSTKPNDAEALDWLAIIAYNNDQYNESIAYASQAIDIEPTELRYYQLLKWLIIKNNFHLTKIIYSQLTVRFPMSLHNYQEIFHYLNEQQIPPVELWEKLMSSIDKI
jgi:protein O-GlcNAc transferase